MKHEINLPPTNKNLAYFSGLILGDGSLPKATSKRKNGRYQTRYHIYFICASLKFVNEVYNPLFKNLFGISPRLVEAKKYNGTILYECRLESKEIYNFLVNDIKLTNGKKAKIAKVPKIPKKFYLDLLAGLLDTDGGKKGSGFGLSTASQELADFSIKMFKKLNLSFHSCPWYYKGHYYHQVYVHKRDFHKLLKHIPLKNVDKIAYLKSVPR